MQLVNRILAKANFNLVRLRPTSGEDKDVAGLRTIFADDVFLVSYPKSGNTWLRFLLGQAKVGRALDFKSIDQVIPDVFYPTDKELLSVPRPRILKSHEAYNEKYPRVILIIRDPRDVAISFYYWRKKNGFFEKRGLNVSLFAYLYQFAEEEIALSPGNWGRHTQSWMEKSVVLGDRMLVIRYEEFLSSTYDAFRRCTEFLKWKLTDEQLRETIEWSTPQRLREAESAVTDKTIDIPFVRKAEAGQWRTVFDNSLNNLYWDRFGKWMKMFGYEKV